MTDVWIFMNDGSVDAIYPGQWSADEVREQYLEDMQHDEDYMEAYVSFDKHEIYTR